MAVQTRTTEAVKAADKLHGRKHHGRQELAEGNPELTAKLLRRLEANIVRCNRRAVERILGEILQDKGCTAEQTAEACNRATAKLREMGKRKEAFLMGAAIYRLTITGLLASGEYRAAGSGQTRGDEDLSRTNDVVAECFRERMFPNRMGGRP